MIKSMTGYASAAATRGSVTVTIELRTYNSRALDLSLRLPSGYADLEERVRAAVGAALTRGRVEAKVQIEDTSEAAGAVEPDLARGRAVLAALERLRTELGVPGTVSLDLLVGGRRPAEDRPAHARHRGGGIAGRRGRWRRRCKALERHARDRRPGAGAGPGHAARAGGEPRSPKSGASPRTWSRTTRTG